MVRKFFLICCGHFVSGLLTVTFAAFLTFFADDENYADEEDNNLPVDDHNTVHHTIISGGPVEPNYSGMRVAEVNMAREKYKKEQKRWFQQ